MDIMDATLEGTKAAFRKGKRPFIEITAAVINRSTL